MYFTPYLDDNDDDADGRKLKQQTRRNSWHSGEGAPALKEALLKQNSKASPVPKINKNSLWSPFKKHRSKSFEPIKILISNEDAVDGASVKEVVDGRGTEKTKIEMKKVEEAGPVNKKAVKRAQSASGLATVANGQATVASGQARSSRVDEGLSSSGSSAENDEVPARSELQCCSSFELMPTLQKQF